MRTIILSDGNEEYTLCSLGAREQAEAWIREKKDSAALALYPTLSADIGLVCRSPLWGGEITPQALRAVSYYFGILAGWPMISISVEAENGKIFLLPLMTDREEKNPQKTTFCKQLFTNMVVLTSSVSHPAVRFCAPFSFIMIESEHTEAVDISLSEGFRTSDALRADVPICFASIEEDRLCLRACMRGHGEMRPDDMMHMRALSYFYLCGRAEQGRLYKGAEGLYRIAGGRVAESLRRVSCVIL